MGFSNQRTINGANALIKVNGAIIGYASGVSVTEAYILNRIDVLGQIDSIDIEAVGRTVTGSIAMMRMTFPSDNATQNLIDALIPGQYGGGAAAAGLVPADISATPSPLQRTQKVMEFMNEGFELQIIDSANFQPDSVDKPKVRYIVKGCRPSSQSFGLSRGSIMGVNVTFEALSLVEADRF